MQSLVGQGSQAESATAPHTDPEIEILKFIASFAACAASFAIREGGRTVGSGIVTDVA